MKELKGTDLKSYKEAYVSMIDFNDKFDQLWMISKIMSISNTNQKKTIMVRLKTMINLSTSKSIMKLLMGI